ncbi:MAG: hypothetical protein PHN49_05805 [Candidatus Omnitrophica bacterium]|nr:hypothetical protein [Candidatus Omnitrophota bacterium]MDD5671132.1 hypothetical protein [Candidatus Omnitrophota bacterium]
MKNADKACILFSIAGAVFFAAVYFVYGMWGHTVIACMYRGESLGILNSVIQGQKELPVDFYFGIADSRFTFFFFNSVVLGIVLMAMSWATVRWGILPVLIWALLGAAISESLIWSVLAKPVVLNYLPVPIRDLILEIYFYYDRRTIQYEPASALYDPELGYTLKPGAFTFACREFNNQFRVNRLGLRDDDFSLEAPDVIILGDSVAMGWGVDQDQTFAEILQQKSHLKVLNTAVSSYGTAREMRLLDRLDTSRLKYLIVQYHPNDFRENEEFYIKGNRWPGADPVRYAERQRAYLTAHSYYPGKYTVKLAGMLKRDLLLRWYDRPRSVEPFPVSHAPDPVTEVKMFLNALIHGSHVDLSRVRVIVIEISPHLFIDDQFVSTLRMHLEKEDVSRYFLDLRVMDLSPVLKDEKYFYLLDDHLNVLGHETVAKVLLQAMQSS